MRLTPMWAARSKAAAPKPVPKEDEEGLALFTWAQTHRWNGIPLGQLLIFIPNGSYLGGSARQRAFQMVRLKQQGFQVGIPDYFLPIPVSRPPDGVERHGLWMELKRQRGGRTSYEQELWVNRLRYLGYTACVVRGFEDAKDAITTYLGGSAWPILTTVATPPQGWPR